MENKLNYIPKDNNFDLIRLILAIVVLLVHAKTLSGTGDFQWIRSTLNSEVAVNAFFTISGFLVTISYFSSRSISHFYLKRIKRVLPAYITVVVLCAVAGVTLTQLPFDEYFSLEWVKYIAANLMFVNFLQDSLPGVFSENKLSAVNGALWTIRFELAFYLALPVFFWFYERCNHKRSLLTVVILGLVALIMAPILFKFQVNSPLVRQVISIAPVLAMHFFLGVVLALYFEKIKAKLVIISTLGLALICIFDLGNAKPLEVFIYGILTITFATRLSYLGNWAKFGDLSYGIYIWHFPIIQTLVSLNVFQFSATLGLLLSIGLSMLFAFFSWKFVERPFLSAKNYYVKQANH